MTKMKNIAIVGGGITGIISAIYLKHLGHNVTMYTNDIGGDFAKGGLKYIHYTEEVKHFFTVIMKLNKYKVQSVIGAILLGEGNYHVDRIEPYPLYYFTHGDIGNLLQRHYWNKTRGDEKFDDRCMNNPKAFSKELKFIPNPDLNGYIYIMTEYIKDNIRIIKNQVTKEDVLDMSKNYDTVIYTIPIQVLIGKIIPEYKMLNIFRYEVEYYQDDFWWDYIYIPDPSVPFHRVSVTKNDNNKLFMDFEINGYDVTDVYKHFSKFIKMYPGVRNFGFISGGVINIKGHISVDMGNEINEIIPKNVLLLGRYAEYDKRVTVDKVISKLYKWSDNGQF